MTNDKGKQSDNPRSIFASGAVAAFVVALVGLAAFFVINKSDPQTHVPPDGGVVAVDVGVEQANDAPTLPDNVERIDAFDWAKLADQLAQARQARDQEKKTSTENTATKMPSRAEQAPKAPLSNANGSDKKDTRPLGRLDKAFIQNTIKQSWPAIKRCFEAALKSDPYLSGKLNVQFEVAGEKGIGGIVEKAKVLDDSTIAESPLDTCMMDEFKTMKFPAPEGGGIVTVRYPFVFTADAEGDPNHQDGDAGI